MLRKLLGTALALPFLLAFPLSAQAPPAASHPAFLQLKSLTGTWEGKTSSGTTVKVTYEVVSGGSVVMERLQSANEPEMITMYSLEGNSLLGTHYCSAGNQPTMQTGPLTAATGKYQFHFVRVAGTKTPDESHMVALTLTIPDKDHLAQVWTFDEHGKTTSETFQYTRKP